MTNASIETRGRTTPEGMLNLSVNVGVADSDVEITVLVRPVASNGKKDANGWPEGFFERVAGSMPELQRASQGKFEERLPFG